MKKVLNRTSSLTKNVEPFYGVMVPPSLGVLSRGTHPGAQLKTFFIFKGFHQEHSPGALLRALLYSKGFV